MMEKLNIIYISCEVSLDFNVRSQHIDTAQQTETAQHVFKNHVHDLFNIAFKYIGNANRIILTTVNGATIAYAGSLEQATLLATDILNGIFTTNKQGLAPLSARIGIHLQAVQEVNDFSEQPNIIGEGIHAAKQMVAKAKPNQILASRAYYENILPSLQALLTLFHYAELQRVELEHEIRADEEKAHDNPVLEKHVAEKQMFEKQAYQKHAPEKQLLGNQTNLAVLHEDQVLKNPPLVLVQTLISPLSTQPSEKLESLNTYNWKYVLAGLLIIIGLFSIAKFAKAPFKSSDKTFKSIPLKASKPTNLKTHPVKPETELSTLNIDRKENVQMKKSVPLQEKFDSVDMTKAIPNKRIPKPKAKKRAKPTLKENKTINWETFKNSIKQGKKIECTQPQIAMNQCR